MMNVKRNITLILSGNGSLKSFSAYPSLLSSMALSFAFMEDFPQKFRLLIRSEILIGKETFLIMGHYVIFCGQTLQMMAKKVSIHLQEVLDTVGVMTFLKSSVTQTT